MIVRRNPPLRRAYPVCLVAALSNATSACNRGNGADGPASRENAVNELDVVGPDSQTNTVADDPSFEGNVVVLHEHGDTEAGAGARAWSGESPRSMAVPKTSTGAAIRQAVTGHELTDGVHWSWKFRPGGRLLSEEHGRRRTGRWDVDRDKLCIDAGYGDRCHTVTRQGRSLRLWYEGAVAVEAGLN